MPAKMTKAMRNSTADLKLPQIGGKRVSRQHAELAKVIPGAHLKNKNLGQSASLAQLKWPSAQIQKLDSPHNSQSSISELS